MRWSLLQFTGKDITIVPKHKDSNASWDAPHRTLFNLVRIGEPSYSLETEQQFFWCATELRLVTWVRLLI